jgi:hypothetical protein
MPSFGGMFCTDADVLRVALRDYPMILPNHQRAAHGEDATFAGLVMTSPSSSFVNQGVIAEMVVHFMEQTTVINGDLLVVYDRTATTITMRRIGFLPGEGQPVVLKAGKTSAKFEVPTAIPQIEEATRQLLQRYRIDSTSELESIFDFRKPCVDLVLSMLYGAAHQLAGLNKDVADNFRAKYLQYWKAYLEGLKALDVTYGSGPSRRRPDIAQFADDVDWDIAKAIWDH